VEAFYENTGNADRLTAKLRDFLTIFHGLQPTLAGGGTDQDVKQFFDSLKVQQSDNRVTLSAAVSVGFIKKLFSEPPPDEAVPAPAPPAASPEKKHTRIRKRIAR
jgi:hypothetical protein